jgi:hypothetical protein
MVGHSTSSSTSPMVMRLPTQPSSDHAATPSNRIFAPVGQHSGQQPSPTWVRGRSASLHTTQRTDTLQLYRSERSTL